ncbi:MAG: hypothetical protein E6K16_02240 [Methanobacteriota archaeon]|nr:MAG: hypothetical protein E6K16_02240 [Euryarchaeota archaeon]
MRSEKDLIAEAVGDLHKDETIERALGRIVRRHGGTYEAYVHVIGIVRELAHREKVTPLEAARRLAQA